MRILLATMASLSIASLASAQQRLDDARFGELQRQLTPDAKATWRSIPWRIDLLAAQAEAAKQRRPLFLWAMDGHPLGCT